MSAIIIEDINGIEYLIPMTSVDCIIRRERPAVITKGDSLPTHIIAKESFERVKNLVGAAYSQRGVLFYDTDGDLAITHTPTILKRDQKTFDHGFDTTKIEETLRGESVQK